MWDTVEYVNEMYTKLGLFYYIFNQNALKKLGQKLSLLYLTWLDYGTEVPLILVSHGIAECDYHKTAKY